MTYTNFETFAHYIKSQNRVPISLRHAPHVLTKRKLMREVLNDSKDKAQHLICRLIELTLAIVDIKANTTVID